MYLKTHTKQQVSEVCELAGTKVSWFSLLARGHGKCSLDLAIELQAASRILAESPEDVMTVDELCGIDQLIKQSEEKIRARLREKGKTCAA